VFMQWHMDNLIPHGIDLLSCNTVIQLWPPLALMLAQGRWTTVVVSPQCRVDPRCNLRSLFVQPGLAPKLNVLDVSNHVVVTPQIYLSLADDLREWA
jgi:hypothetical protein